MRALRCSSVRLARAVMAPKQVGRLAGRLVSKGTADIAAVRPAPGPCVICQVGVLQILPENFLLVVGGETNPLHSRPVSNTHRQERWPAWYHAIASWLPS